MTEHWHNLVRRCEFDHFDGDANPVVWSLLLLPRVLILLVDSMIYAIGQLRG